MMAFKATDFEAPTRPTNYPDHLWPYIERVLEQHLATRDKAFGGGDISITEAVARRCAQLSVAKKCWSCKGERGAHVGIVWEPCEKCAGTGQHLTPQLPKVPLATKECPSCKGQELPAWRKAGFAAGSASSGDYRRREVWTYDCSAVVTQRPDGTFKVTGRAYILPNRAFGEEQALAWCVRCKHTGYLDGLSAAPGQPKQEPTGTMPDENAAGKHAKLSAVLRRLQETDTQSALVLEVHCGPIGAETRRRAAHDHYRELAIWPLTTPGVRLLRLAGGARKGTPQRALSRLMDVQLEQPSPMVMALVEECQRAAWSLLARARASLFAADSDGVVAKAANRLWEVVS